MSLRSECDLPRLRGDDSGEHSRRARRWGRLAGSSPQGPQLSAWVPHLLAEGCEKTMEEHNLGDANRPDWALAEADSLPGGRKGGQKAQLLWDEV